MIELVQGNFFDYPADIRVNTVNCVGVMGAGVALAFKQKYPKMFKEYSKVCKEKEIAPDKPHVWENHVLFEGSSDENITIVNLPTKIHWRNKSEYEYIENGLKWLSEFLDERTESTITLPALGCGHGGLDWGKVKEMIFVYLKDSPANILVFEPKSSKEAGSNQAIKKHLLYSKNILSLLPSDSNYPEKLLGKVKVETFFRGELGLLKNSSLGILTSSKEIEKEVETVKTIIDSIQQDKKSLPLVFNGSNKATMKSAEYALSKNLEVILVLSSGIAELGSKYENYIENKNLLVVSTGSLQKRFSRGEFSSSGYNTAFLSDALLLVCKNINWMKKNFSTWIKACPKYFTVNFKELSAEDESIITSLNAEKINKSKSTLRANLKPIEKYFTDLRVKV